MWYIIFGALLIFTGFYLFAKGILSRKNGIKLSATLIGFSQEGDSQYPLFKFTYNGEEYTISSSAPAKSPEKYKHSVGENVNIIFSPKNTKYVDVEGEYTDFLYAAGSLIFGIILVVASILK